jgi:hypothetical protein
LQYVPSLGGVVLLKDVPPFDYVLGLADRSTRRVVPAWAHRLIDEDRREAGVLIETLHAYVDADMRIGRTAERLAVHPNTVQNRLRRVRAVTGRSTRRFGDLLQLITCVRLLAPERGAGVHFNHWRQPNDVHSDVSGEEILDP